MTYKQLIANALRRLKTKEQLRSEELRELFDEVMTDYCKEFLRQLNEKQAPALGQSPVSQTMSAKTELDAICICGAGGEPHPRHHKQCPRYTPF